MVKSNYTFEKRQKEIAKKKKKEEKRLKKLAAAAGDNQAGQAQSDNDPANIDGHVWSRRKRISLFPYRSGDFNIGFHFFHRNKPE